MNRRKVGEDTEAQARSFLEKEGYRVMESNFRCRQGEIDIIAEESDTICFIEVKYRSSLRCGYPEESVTADKQRKIIRSALFYLGLHQISANVRFDVVSILPGEIRLIRNAFEYRNT
ncbi:YraN family protein [Candidatus Weimeria sp. HCP3S3_B5]|uniref:YraN family protein n=1 Tax=Candidatus Weimeria sp. HCP3S3_B5 TaxID=3438871 RepID=UPI003070615D|nr:YraN family protein [Lachnospiraceae bacterium]